MTAKFGREMREKEFGLNPESAHLTHGSWGIPPNTVCEAQKKIAAMIDWEPDTFFRFKMRDMWFETVDAIAEFLNAKPENTVMVTNVTTAINTVLKCLPLSKGDGILIYSWTYAAIQRTCESTAEQKGCEVVCVEVKLPVLSKQQIIDSYRECLDKHPNVKVAVIEYICSPTAVVLPVKELIVLCRERGVLTMLDAAHVPGQIAINLETLGCDFFTGNFHKWVYCPRSCAVLWVDPKHHSYIHPLVTSHVYKHSDWRQDFVPQGTIDYSPLLACKHAIQFYKDIGGMEAISAYNTTLVEKAQQLMTEKFGTKRFPVPQDMEAPYMRMVCLPLPDSVPSDEMVFEDFHLLMRLLNERFKVITSAFRIEGLACMRICAQIYNTLDEYERAVDTISTLSKEIIADS